MDGDALGAAAYELGDFGQQARMAVPVLVDLRGKLGLDTDELIDEALEKIRAEKSPSPPGDVEEPE